MKKYFRFFLVFSWLLTGLLTTLPSHANVLVEQTFATGSPGWTLGGNATINNGWLRLTNATTDGFGYAFYGTSFSISQSFVIDFEFVSWGGSGADGLTFFMFNGGLNNNNFRIGDDGGSLGYANGCNNDDGMREAYLGIAFDEFGNFSNAADRCKSGGPGAVSDAVTIRGPGNYTTGGVGTNYAYVTHGVAPTSIDCPAPTCTTRPTNTSANWRRARITMLKSGATSWSAYVDVQFGAGQAFTRVINPTTMPNLTYASLKLGFAASTGGSTNYHEIRNLKVTNAADMSISKTAPAEVMVGGTFNYVLTVTNAYTDSAGNVTVTDTLPTGPSYSNTVGLTGSGGTGCSLSAGPPRLLSCGLGNMTSGQSRTITVSATNAGATQQSLSNTAQVDQDDNDINPNNNSSTVNTTVWAQPSLMVTKSATNTGGSSITSTNPGSDIAYTIQITNTGGPSKTYVLTDAMSPFTALYLNAYGSNTPFQFNAGNSGLTMPAGSIQYSNNNGSTWTYTPVSGGGGAPAGYDGTVTNFRITLTGTMGTLTSGSTSYSLNYRSRVE
ncbi:MAG: hypothetical protein ACRERR_01580 [Moraxellaceae bacterium]